MNSLIQVTSYVGKMPELKKKESSYPKQERSSSIYFQSRKLEESCDFTDSGLTQSDEEDESIVVMDCSSSENHDFSDSSNTSWERMYTARSLRRSAEAKKTHPRHCRHHSQDNVNNFFSSQTQCQYLQIQPRDLRRDLQKMMPPLRLVPRFPALLYSFEMERVFIFPPTRTHKAISSAMAFTEQPVVRFTILHRVALLIRQALLSKVRQFVGSQISHACPTVSVSGSVELYEAVSRPSLLCYVGVSKMPIEISQESPLPSIRCHYGSSTVLEPLKDAKFYMTSTFEFAVSAQYGIMPSSSTLHWAAEDPLFTQEGNAEQHCLVKWEPDFGGVLNVTNLSEVNTEEVDVVEEFTYSYGTDTVRAETVTNSPVEDTCYITLSATLTKQSTYCQSSYDSSHPTSSYEVDSQDFHATIFSFTSQTEQSAVKHPSSSSLSTVKWTKFLRDLRFV